MGVQLNIKDPETVRLARELAGASGRSVTETIRRALQREWDSRSADADSRRKAILAAVAEFHEAMPTEWQGRSSKEIMDDIYDERGLPK